MTKKSGEEKAEDLNDYNLSIKDAADFLGMSVATVKRRADEKQIAHVRAGTGERRPYWFRKSDLEHFKKFNWEVVDVEDQQHIAYLDEQTVIGVDEATNEIIDEVYASNKKPFRGWSKADWNELYSMHGNGGSLTREGVLVAAQEINELRDIRSKFEAVIRSDHRSTLKAVIDSLYSQVAIKPKPKK